MIDLGWGDKTEMRCPYFPSATTGNRHVRNADLDSTKISGPCSVKRPFGIVTWYLRDKK